jgi:hypothetical protein
MDHLNWGYIQLGLVTLAFGGLQVWWISSVFRRRDLTPPLSEGQFRQSLERIWEDVLRPRQLPHELINKCNQEVIHSLQYG